MKYVTEELTNTVEIKKSKFIASICSYDNFDLTMKLLKEKHPKARHYVYAYRYLNEFNQIVENCSDDGEPRGTSGRPSLKVMDGQGLINTAVIIVRYFGGVKLGTGGLVRAYSEAVNQVIAASTQYEFQHLIRRKLTFSYSLLSPLEYLLKNLGISIEEKIFEQNVVLHLTLTEEQKNSLSDELPLGIELSE